jgi:hypothetical protein
MSTPPRWWPFGKGGSKVTEQEQWTDAGEPEPPVDSPPLESEEGPPAHDDGADAGGQAAAGQDGGEPEPGPAG